MSQSRLHSFIEAWANVLVGFLVGLISNIVVLPLFGHAFTFIENVGITLTFTVVSVIRGYGVRRFFVWWHRRKG